jgi:hypothetical protein
MIEKGFPSTESRREGLEFDEFEQVHGPRELDLPRNFTNTEGVFQIRDDLRIGQIVGVQSPEEECELFVGVKDPDVILNEFVTREPEIRSFTQTLDMRLAPPGDPLMSGQALVRDDLIKMSRE